jgi:ABC-type bacteriocin/lantibiotic exporter with double-glycine peptidase domain
MFKSFVAVYKLILPEFRNRFYSIVLLSIIVAVIETAGVSSVAPFIALLVDPRLVKKNDILSKIFTTFQGGGDDIPLHFFGLFSITVIMLANISAVFLSWQSIKFTSNLSVALSEELSKKHFDSPFIFFLNNSPAILTNQLCVQVSTFGSSGALQLCYSIAKIAQIFVLTPLLFFMAPKITSLLATSLLTLYICIHKVNIKKIKEAGKLVVEGNEQANHFSFEMYENARQIILLHVQDYFISKVAGLLSIALKGDALSRFLPSLPKYAIEVMAACLVFMIPIYSSFVGGDPRSDLPLLATFAYAGFRLLPILQQLYTSISILHYYEPAATKLSRIIISDKFENLKVYEISQMPAVITFKNISFTYPTRSDPAINNISFSIKKGERVAIVGSSGSGKSTLMDIFLGLLRPSSGDVYIDNELISGAFKWQKDIIGFVPQKPMILQDSILRNIAFGLSEIDINYDRCVWAAEKVRALDFIKKLPQGMSTRIAADGSFLSGGEVQRLTVARALYTSPELLMLDEPASSLDPSTASQLFDTLWSSDLDITVIAITHNLEFLGGFDRVIYFSEGRIVMSGTEQELIQNCEEYRIFRQLNIEQ